MAASTAAAQGVSETVQTGTDAAREWADDVEAKAEIKKDQMSEQMPIVQEARLVGGAMITILLIAIVLNEVFNAVDVGSGPFSSIGTDLETTGVAAMGLLVVGLLIVAANAILSRFGGGF